ncbi:trans-aconitate 2-methyltransferase [Xanthobacter dioxanivorans]|uniref:Trans-aconitate 2-methyltransferase n=1 Tax=Xanthobacter dioxanivorans TaxID=2528964 RepID=A0A974PP09_9HYPH|nr:trans-aconitate 2-methyltransferase [Xanthobacter dioxanivorans]QRG07127.1 trans-aconitate 2-methyltransferase [Xanthobacter dioxanivorans]
MPADWNASQYLKFEDERTRPSRDLLAQVPRTDAAFVVDLGCGPGNSTELLAARFPAAEVLGLDTSPDMLAAARTRLPQARFELADASTFTLPKPADLIFANAVLQWVPEHAALLPRLLSLLAPGGVLAVQMPDNLDEPSHVAMRETAMAGPWAEKLERATRARTMLPAPGAYYDMLAPHAGRVDIWHTIYNHPLDGVAAIVEWVKGTGLRPFVDPLEGDERVQFLEEYAARLVDPYPPRVDGKVLLAFPRLFMVAVR